MPGGRRPLRGRGMRHPRQQHSSSTSAAVSQSYARMDARGSSAETLEQQRLEARVAQRSLVAGLLEPTPRRPPGPVVRARAACAHCPPPRRAAAVRADAHQHRALARAERQLRQYFAELLAPPPMPRMRRASQAAASTAASTTSSATVTRSRPITGGAGLRAAGAANGARQPRARHRCAIVSASMTPARHARGRLR